MGREHILFFRRSKAPLRHDFGAQPAFPCAGEHFLEPVHRLHCAPLGNDRCGAPRSAQRACVDRDPRMRGQNRCQNRPLRMGLRHACLSQRTVKTALKTAFDIPFGLAVAQKIKRGIGHRLSHGIGVLCRTGSDKLDFVSALRQNHAEPKQSGKKPRPKRPAEDKPRQFLGGDINDSACRRAPPRHPDHPQKHQPHQRQTQTNRQDK